MIFLILQEMKLSEQRRTVLRIYEGIFVRSGLRRTVRGKEEELLNGFVVCAFPRITPGKMHREEKRDEGFSLSRKLSARQFLGRASTRHSPRSASTKATRS